MNISLIDYKISNMFSIKNALDKLGFSSQITSDQEVLLNSDAAILPGVGSYPEAMKQLKKLKLDNAIKDFVKSKRKFMGICLGLQLLFTRSEEFENTYGLNIISGEVKKLNSKNNKFIIPHLGWNKAIFKNDKINFKTKLLKDNDFYFVHSFYVDPRDKSIISSETKYAEINFCSSIVKDNIFACQFHPEKSREQGLKLFDFFKN
jgi:glutamine amidotransferase